MPITIDGIVSGLDTSSIIEALVDVYSAPKALLEDKVSTLETRSESLAELMGLLGDLEDALQDMEIESKFWSYEATSSNEDALTATATNGVIPGSHTLEVLDLASTATAVSNGFSSGTALGTLTEGTYTVKYGDAAAVSITLDGTNSSLEGLAQEINDGVDGVYAYVLDAGGADATRYKLVITGEDTGDGNDIVVTEPGTELGVVTTQEATDARIKVDGITIYSATNTVTAAIPGVTLSLHAESTSAFRLTVDRDAAAAAEKVQAVVDAYNEVVVAIAAGSQFDADEGVRGPFVGEASVRRVSQGLSTVLSSTFGSGTFQALSMVGIESDWETGMVTFDTDAFEEALQEDADGVGALFSGLSGFAQTMLDQVDVYLDTVNGSLVNRADSIEETIDDYNERIADWEERAAAYEERLLNSFTNMEVILGSLQTAQDTLTALFETNNDDDS